VAEPIIAEPHCGSHAYPPNHCHALGAVPTSQPAAHEDTAIPTKPKSNITRSGQRCCGSNKLMPPSPRERPLPGIGNPDPHDTD